MRSAVVADLRVGLGGCGGLVPQLGGEELVPGPGADGVSRRWQQSAVADGFTITGAKIVAIDLTDDPRRIAEADLVILSR